MGESLDMRCNRPSPSAGSMLESNPHQFLEKCGSAPLERIDRRFELNRVHSQDWRGISLHQIVRSLIRIGWFLCIVVHEIETLICERSIRFLRIEILISECGSILV